MTHHITLAPQPGRRKLSAGAHPATVTPINNSHRPRAGRGLLASPTDVPWPFGGVPQRSPWRLVAAVGAITEAIGHIPVIRQHLSEAPYIGVGFILLTVAGLILAHFLLLNDTIAVWACVATIAAAALGGYLLSRTVGLPQIHDDIGNWSEPLGIVCIVAEAIMLTVACLQLWSRTGEQ